MSRGSIAALVSTVLFTLAVALPSTALAGTPVYGEGATLDEAMKAATQNVEKAAHDAHRCVSRYPSVETCTQLQDGRFRCVGIRANHKGSCN